MALIGRLTLTDGTAILAVTHDPTATGTKAAVGSLCIRVATAPALYQKTGSGDTAWTQRTAIGSFTPVAQGGGGVTTTIDLSTGPSQQLQLNSATTNLLLTNPVAGQTYTLAIIQGGGGQLVVWPGAVKWPGAGAPTLSIAPGAKDLFTLYYDGTIFYGHTVGLAFA